jgi:hypothetical protein
MDILRGIFRTSLSVKALLFFWVSLFARSEEGKAQTVIVSWQANSEPDLAGYKVYYGTHSRRYGFQKEVGLVTISEIAVLPPGDVVYFSVTAYDSSGNESDYSNEVAVHRHSESGPFMLLDNYPNPFNPATRIPYLLLDRMKIRITVYDLMGREVRVLAEGEKPAGQHEAVWDGTDKKGRVVANGVYICRLVVGQFALTKKLTLAR